MVPARPYVLAQLIDHPLGPGVTRNADTFHRETGGDHIPTPVLGPEQILARHDGIVEENLVELMPAGHAFDGPHSDSWCAKLHQEDGEAVVTTTATASLG